VAIGALFGRGLVKQYGLSLNLALQLVAHGASDVCMSPLQGEIGPLVVIER
jgi:hypothetical protein